jgi:hypothetical protein
MPKAKPTAYLLQAHAALTQQDGRCDAAYDGASLPARREHQI